ncbi:MAG: hypothetical protein ACI4OP_01255 [Candidatus Coprovivens sp.]
MPVDEVKIPNILWLLFAIPLWLMALVVGNETSESRKQIEMEKSKQIEKSLDYNDISTYSSDEYEEYLRLKKKFETE